MLVVTLFSGASSPDPVGIDGARGDAAGSFAAVIDHATYRRSVYATLD